MKSSLLVAGALLFCTAQAAFADPLFTLSFEPGPGLPGSVRGWGFTIVNDTNRYLAIEQALLAGLNTVGTFEEFAATNFVVVNPLSSLTQNFLNDGSSGMGRFTILNTAAFGSYAGAMDVFFSLYVNDPNDPLFSPDAGDTYGLIGTDIAAPVIVGNVSAVPEPASMTLTGLAGIGAIWLRLTRRKQ
jgi:hypothetical protein